MSTVSRQLAKISARSLALPTPPESDDPLIPAKPDCRIGTHRRSSPVCAQPELRIADEAGCLADQREGPAGRHAEGPATHKPLFVERSLPDVSAETSRPLAACAGGSLGQEPGPANPLAALLVVGDVGG
jgi:hypothetical protein